MIKKLIQWFNYSCLAECVRRGTILPKGHGKLVDADKEYGVEVITRGNCMMCGKELVDGLFFCKECENKANNRK